MGTLLPLLLVRGPLLLDGAFGRAVLPTGPWIIELPLDTDVLGRRNSEGSDTLRDC